jgi:uncharacterized protein YdhG (YjbR/CyaY superfamily)
MPMHSTAPDVLTYLQHVPLDRVACLTELRQLCLNTLLEYEEAMDYGMPCYKKHGMVEVAFASQKRYIALYIAKQTVVDAYRGELAGLSVGKGCIRYPKPEKVDFTVIIKLLRATRDSPEQAC